MLIMAYNDISMTFGITKPSNVIFCQNVIPYFDSCAEVFKPCTTLGYVAVHSPMRSSLGNFVQKVVQCFVCLG